MSGLKRPRGKDLKDSKELGPAKRKAASLDYWLAPKPPPPVDDSSVLAKLKSVFNFDSFRPGQKEIVDAILNGNDVLAILPTGAGKTLCFTLPGLLRPGITIVVSPLLALMQNQIEAMKSLKINAASYSSATGVKEKKRILADIQSPTPKTKFLYVTPESLLSDAFRREITQIHTPPCVIIDEAHCASAWGHDFRVKYSQLGLVRSYWPDRQLQFVALTATATPKVREDIEKILGMGAKDARKLERFVGDCRRMELFFEVRFFSYKDPRQLAEARAEQEKNAENVAAPLVNVQRTAPPANPFQISGFQPASLAVPTTLSTIHSFSSASTLAPTSTFGKASSTLPKPTAPAPSANTGFSSAFVKTTFAVATGSSGFVSASKIPLKGLPSSKPAAAKPSLSQSRKDEPVQDDDDDEPADEDPDEEEEEDLFADLGEGDSLDPFGPCTPYPSVLALLTSNSFSSPDPKVKRTLPTIIYVPTRKHVTAISERLVKDGYLARGYHAGLKKKERQDLVTIWSAPQSTIPKENEKSVDVMVCTIAFGMGLDKPDVRLLVHYSLPQSLEAYLQESGRAGRDGQPARCVLFYSREDRGRIEYLISGGGRGGFGRRIEGETEEASARRIELETASKHRGFEKVRSFIASCIGHW